MSRKLETLADLNVGDYLWFEGEARCVASVTQRRKPFSGDNYLVWWDVEFCDGQVEELEDGGHRDMSTYGYDWLIADDAEIAELRRVEVLHFRAAARMWFYMAEAREGTRRAFAAVGIVLP